MRLTLVALLTALCLLTPATIRAQANAAPILGQQPVNQGLLYWKSPNAAGNTLYVLATKYMRDSSGTRVNLDTAVNSVGTVGACSQTYIIQNSTFTQPQSRTQLSYRIRATGGASDSVRFRYYGRYRNPAGRDSNWTSAQYLWNNVPVLLAHDVPAAATTFSTRYWNAALSAEDIRLCVERVSVAPGDTVVITLPYQASW